MLQPRRPASTNYSNIWKYKELCGSFPHEADQMTVQLNDFIVVSSHANCTKLNIILQVLRAKVVSIV
jgi:hypothetical protein